MINNIDQLLKSVKRIHFIGIGGSGMCPLAEILHAKGYQLSGSDNNESDTLDRIRKLGIPVFLGHKAENIGDAEMVIHTAAIMNDNEELIAVKERGLPLFERAVLLGAITKHYNSCIGVSGTHGKTTVTSMLTQIMIYAKTEPTAVIGGKLPLINANSIVGKSDIMICEACEFNDHFLELDPNYCVILNIDNDHMEYFKTMDNMISSYEKFAKMCDKKIFVNGDDLNSLKAVENISKDRIITFGMNSKSDYYPTEIGNNSNSKMSQEFVLNFKDAEISKIVINVPGKHNIINAIAAAAVAIELGADTQSVSSALGDFKGAGRRFEVLGESQGIVVADDYAHHPEELKVTLEAAMGMGYKNVWAVFQPFTYSRTAMLLDDFATALKISDKVVLSEIMGSREKNTYGIYSKDLAAKVPGSVWFKSFEEIADYVSCNAKSGDLVITLGCGDVYKAAKLILTKLNEMA